jgi:tagatose-1,6-bisphosphate aldolase non-catalytic subunit AgaZ/GatZ
MKSFAILAAFAFVSLASSARADDKTIVLKDHIVYGRAARPMAVTELTKLPMQSTVTDLKQPFVQRVEQAVQAKPF